METISERIKRRQNNGANRRYFQDLAEPKFAESMCASPEPITRPSCPSPLERQSSMYGNFMVDELVNEEPKEFDPWSQYVQVELRHPDAKMPTLGSLESAGYDLYTIEDQYLPAGVVTKVDIKIALKLPVGTYGRIASRSGNALKGLISVGGVIDRDYTGNIGVLVHNINSEEYYVEKGTRIAQLIVEVCRNPMLIKIDYMKPTSRGHGGYGSTGI